MAPYFSIDVQRNHNLVRITIAGFFGADDIDRFLREREEAHTRLSCAPNGHLTLVDMRGMDIQPQESVDRFREIINDPAYTSRRIAVVVGPSLAASQIKRAAAKRDAAYFTELEQAQAWLLSDDCIAARRHWASERYLRSPT